MKKRARPPSLYKALRIKGACSSKLAVPTDDNELCIPTDYFRKYTHNGKRTGHIKIQALSKTPPPPFVEAECDASAMMRALLEGPYEAQAFLVGRGGIRYLWKKSDVKDAVQRAIRVTRDKVEGN